MVVATVTAQAELSADSDGSGIDDHTETPFSISCPSGQYLFTASPSNAVPECQNCTVCAAHEVTAMQCTSDRDTLCLSGDPATSQPFNDVNGMRSPHSCVLPLP